MEQIGFLKSFGISALLTLLLSVAYYFMNGPFWTDRKKTFLSLLIAGAVGVFWLFYQAIPCTFANVADFVIFGIEKGCTTIGLFKVGQAIGVFTPGGK